MIYDPEVGILKLVGYSIKTIRELVIKLDNRNFGEVYTSKYRHISMYIRKLC